MQPLQDRWQFPSDHLPIGIVWQGLVVASWNVLNTKFIGFIVKQDTQGLKRSMIGDLNTPSRVNGVTQRDLRIIDLANEMLANGVNILGLQECGLPFLRLLTENIPSNYELLANLADPTLIDQVALIYDKNILQVVEYQAIAGVFSNRPNRAIQNAVFRTLQTNNSFQIINAHLPGEPGNPAPQEFKDYLATQTLPTLAMGDMNASHDVMLNDDYLLVTPYNTTISSSGFKHIAIDHFIILGDDGIDLLESEEILKGLNQAVALIN